MPITVTKSDITVARLQHKEFLAGKAGSFVAGLFDLISHANIGNRRKLALGFPEYVYVFMQHVGELERIDFDVKEV